MKLSKNVKLAIGGVGLSVVVGALVTAVTMFLIVPLYRGDDDEETSAGSVVYTKHANRTIPQLFSDGMQRCAFNFKRLIEAKDACTKNPECGGVVSRNNTACFPDAKWSYEIRKRGAGLEQKKGTFAHVKRSTLGK